MACSATSPRSVGDYLRQTSKGRLFYDPIGSKDIQDIVENVKRKQNSLIVVSPPHSHASEPPLSRHDTSSSGGVDVTTSELSKDVPIVSSTKEQNETCFFDMNDTIFALHLSEYDQERKRHIQAAWAQRKMAMDQFSAEATEKERLQLEMLRKEKYLHAQQLREQEKAQREAVIEEKKQWEQNQRVLHNQHSQRLNDRVKEVELTQKRLEQQAALKRQQDILNRQHMDELVTHQKTITALYSEINSVLSQCSHKELLPTSVKQALSKQKDVAAVMDQLVSNVSQRAIVPEDLLLAKQQVQQVKGYLQIVQQGVELTNRLAEEQAAVAQAGVTSSLLPSTSAVTPGSETQGNTTGFPGFGMGAGFASPVIDVAKPNSLQPFKEQHTTTVKPESSGTSSFINELTNRSAEEQAVVGQPGVTSSLLPITSAATPDPETHGNTTGFSAQTMGAGFASPVIDVGQPNSLQPFKEQYITTVKHESSDASSVINEELYHYVSPDALKMYTRLRSNLLKHQQTYQQLLTDQRPTTKKYRFDLQKAVNIPVNAISPLSGTHVRDKLERLKRLLMGQPVEVTEKRVSTNEHPQAILMCKDLLARKFVKQGEEQVSSKHESAFAIAATIIGLWREMPDFGHLLLAHFHQKCPVTVPYYIPKEEGQSQEDHYRAMGYLYIDGTIEKQDKFLKRMSGMVRLYAAIICSPVPRNIRSPHPHGIENGWIWLTRILNLDPIPDLTATVLFDFLETAGSCLLQTYGKQFQKMLVTLCKELFPKIHQVTPSGSGGPLTRLENFLQKCLQCGKMPSPEGFLPTNFWYT